MSAGLQRKNPCVAFAGFHIESVSFLPAFATLADFERVALRGPGIIESLRGTNTVIGGFIDVLEENTVDMLPIVHAALGAVGPASDEAVHHYATEIAAGVRDNADRIDGVLLFLHGACWAPSYPDPERYILGEVRAVLGPDKPLMVAFDYHGNVDAATLENVDAAFAYRKSPHTDTGHTGERAANCMVRTLKGEIKPVWAIAKPGVLVPSIFSATALAPLADIIASAADLEQSRPEIIDVTVMAGFSYADAHNTGFSVLAVADANRASAQAVADEVSSSIWTKRHALYRPMPVYEVSEAIDHVLGQVATRPPTGKPYVLLEHADRMNDSTYILAALLDRGVQGASVPFLWDPAAAARALEAGAGSTVELSLGGHSSEKAGPVLKVNARILWAGKKEFRISGSYMHGMPVDLGVTALLDVNGISISVVSYPAFGVDGDPFYLFGQRPEDFEIIVLRSKTHFRDFYEPVAQEILIVDTPDYGPANLLHLPYAHLDTAVVYPFFDGDKPPK